MLQLEMGSLAGVWLTFTSPHPGWPRNSGPIGVINLKLELLGCSWLWESSQPPVFLLQSGSCGEECQGAVAGVLLLDCGGYLQNRTGGNYARMLFMFI